jgi:predicted dehydrogenase
MKPKPKVKWGILGVARIATQKVISAMKRGEHSEVYAIASRDLAKAQAAAASLGIPRAYGSYEELLADPDVEAIYNPLPNHLHVPWTIRAAEAGKHVLCEKPIARDTAEAAPLLAVRDRTGMLIQEAFMIRYLIHTARFVFGREPRRVATTIERDRELGVDTLTSLLLDFAPGHAIGTCGTQMVSHQRVEILGDHGRLAMEYPFNSPPDRPCRLVVDDGSDLFGGGREEIALEPCDQYTLQGDRFSQAVRGLAPLAYPLEDTISNMRDYPGEPI